MVAGDTSVMRDCVMRLRDDYLSLAACYRTQDVLLFANFCWAGGSAISAYDI